MPFEKYFIKSGIGKKSTTAIFPSFSSDYRICVQSAASEDFAVAEITI